MPKAMVIDDSRAIRLILGRLLSGLGYQVLPAGDGREALDVLKRESDGMALALVDWNMPGMTGIEFVRAVRAIPKHDPMALIMVTTETGAEQMMAAIQAGADEYVMKPFTAEMIAEKIDMVAAAGKRALQQNRVADGA